MEEREMKIVVLVKQVPDTTDVRLDEKTGNLIRETKKRKRNMIKNGIRKTENAQ